MSADLDREASPSLNHNSSTAPVDSGWRQYKACWVALALYLAVFAAYARALFAGYVWDDNFMLTANPVIYEPGGLWRIWFEPAATQQYYPLYQTAFWVEYRLWGFWPAGYHAVNVLLHATNAALVWMILTRLNVPGAGLAAAIFALHPVHVESVAWVAEQKNTLSGFFYLAAVLTYLRFDPPFPSTPEPLNPRPPEPRPPDPRRARRLWAIAFALFLCALLSKTVTCTLPAAVLLILWWKRRHLNVRTVLPLAPFLIFAGLVPLLTIHVERVYGQWPDVNFGLSILDRLLIAGRAVWFYLGKLVWPAGLSSIYPRWTIDHHSPTQYIPAVAAAAAIGALWLARNLGRAPAAAAFYFFGTLAPALGFIGFSYMYYSFVADRFAYLASIGPIAAATAIIHPIIANKPRVIRWAGWLGTAGLAATLGVLTFARSAIYRDLDAYWGGLIVDKSPNAWLAHYNLGVARMEERKYDKAMSHLRLSLHDNPGFAAAHNNLGFIESELQQTEEAGREYREAIRLDPLYADAYNNLAALYMARSQWDSAVDFLHQAIRLKPGHIGARMNLAQVLTLQGRRAEAREQYREVLKISPRHRAALAGLRSLGAE